MNILDSFNLKKVSKTIMNQAASFMYAGQPINPKTGAYSQERGQRGLNAYTVSQILEATGRNKDGEISSYGVEQPYFYLTPNQRIEIYKLCPPVQGLINGRKLKISNTPFTVIPKKAEEDRIYDEYKNLYSIYKEYSNTQELKYLVIKAKIGNILREEMPDILPDLSNFNKSILRWKRKIQNTTTQKTEEIIEWLQEPKSGVNWSDFVKKWVEDLLVHGASGIYKDVQNNKLENFDTLPGGTIYPFKDRYFSNVYGFFQIVSGFEPQMFMPEELAYSQYMPTSSQSHGIVPLESLINKVCEYLLFDRLMADQADGTKPPEKLIIVTENKNPFGDFDKTEEIPLEASEQKRIETKLNQPRKYPIITFSGNDAKLIDLTRENTMPIQIARQKDIREDIALVFNASNMEMNLTGSDNTSGRSTAESQQEESQDRGISPMLNQLEELITKQILPYRFGIGYKLQFEHSKNDTEERQLDALKLNNGELTINELREKYGLTQFDDEQYNVPHGSIEQPQGQNELNPLFTKQIQ